LVLSASTALADEHLTEGIGVKVGEGTVLHPRVGLETGFVSNVFYEEDSPTASGVARLVGELSVAPDGGEHRKPGGDLDFRAGLKLEYEAYLSSDEAAQDQRNLGVSAFGKVTVSPNGPYIFNVKDEFDRVSRPVNYESSDSLVRDINRLSVDLTWRPPASSISVKAGYQNTIDFFESSASEFANRLHHMARLRGTWQFLPITQFFSELSLGFFGQLGDAAPPTDVEAKSDSMPFAAQIVTSTAITED